jgi:hypothetical protein
MAYAIIENGVVANVAEASPEFAKAKGWPALVNGYGIGDLYQGGSFLRRPLWASLDESKAELKARVADRHSIEEQRGVRYTFPDGQEDVIQTRDAKDLRNIDVQLGAANALKAKGVTEPVMMFRGESNVNHIMTPDQMIDMGVAVVMMGQQTYEAKWQKDDQIDHLQTLEEAESFDIDSGWPQ